MKASPSSALSAKAIYWGLTWINKLGTNAGHRVLYKRTLKVATYKPNRNRSTHKYNCRPPGIKCIKLWWRLHYCQHWARKRSIENLQSTNQAQTPTNNYRTNELWKQPHMNQTKIIARTSTNAGHRVLYVQSSDEGFTIFSIERKSDLLRTYNHIQTKQKP